MFMGKFIVLKFGNSRPGNRPSMFSEPQEIDTVARCLRKGDRKWGGEFRIEFKVGRNKIYEVNGGEK